MKFFLTSFVDQDFRSYIRDLVRALKPVSRNIEARNYEELYLNYKFLGQDLTNDTIKSLLHKLNSYKQSVSLKSFALEVEKVSLGKKSEVSPEQFFTEVKDRSSFNKLSTILHELAINSGNDRIIRKKDHPAILGVIKIAKITTNISTQQLEFIREFLLDYPEPPAVKVDNFSIISTSIRRSKQRIIKHTQLYLE